MRIVRQFDEEIMAELGVPPGGAWTYRDWTRRVGFGHMKGLARCHAYVGDILLLLKQGHPDQGALLAVQLLKAIHQAYLDDGSWDSAALHLSTPDFYRRRLHGGSEREAEVLAQYRRSLADLRRLEVQTASASSSGAPPTPGALQQDVQPNPRPKAKAKEKAGGKKKRDNDEA